MQNTFARVVETMQSIGVAGHRIDESNSLEQLQIDSLDMVDLTICLEDEFEIELSDDVVGNFKTVGDIVRHIEVL